MSRAPSSTSKFLTLAPMPRSWTSTSSTKMEIEWPSRASRAHFFLAELLQQRQWRRLSRPQPSSKSPTRLQNPNPRSTFQGLHMPRRAVETRLKGKNRELRKCDFGICFVTCCRENQAKKSNVLAHLSIRDEDGIKRSHPPWLLARMPGEIRSRVLALQGRYRLHRGIRISESSSACQSRHRNRSLASTCGR